MGTADAEINGTGTHLDAPKFSVPRQSLLVSKDAKTTCLHCSRPLQAYKGTVCTFSELVEALLAITC